MLQKRDNSSAGPRGFLVSAWRRSIPLHPILVNLLYAAVLGSALDHILTIGPPLADVPSRVWAVALAVVAFLRPYGVRWLFAAIVAIVLAPGSLPLAALAFGAALGAIILAPEDPDHAVPVRFALLAAAPLAAVNEMAILPLAIGVSIVRGGAWWEGTLQAIAIAGFAGATGVVLPWSGLPEASAPLNASRVKLRERIGIGYG